METAHGIFGACAACAAAVAGAVGGASIATDPITDRGDTLASLPDHAVSAPQIDRTARSLPNHYPLETPSGTIEVAELSSHGLYRNRRFAESYYRGDFDPGQAMTATDHYRSLPGKPNLTAIPDSADQRRLGAPAERPVRIALDIRPLPPIAAERPARIEADGAERPETQSGPRTIDVAAALAARN